MTTEPNQSIDVQRVLEEDKNAIILTPNQPLAQQLRRHRLESLNTHKRANGAHTPKTDILVMNAWMQNSVTHTHLFNPHTDIAEQQPKLATDMQLLVLMEQALHNSQGQFLDLNPQTLASQALSAWRNLKRYKVSIAELKQAEVGQKVCFSNTFETMDEMLKARNLTTPEIAIIHALKSSSSIDQQPIVYLYAFIESLPPLIQEWLTTCFQQVRMLDYRSFCIKEEQPSKINAPQTELYVGKDENDELSAAIHWAVSVTNKNANARVGIIYRDLSNHLTKTERLLDDAISTTPRYIKRSTSVSAPAISIGAIQAALGLLQMNRREISNADARFILHTPFWGQADTEHEVRAAWDKRLCYQRKRQFKPEALTALLDEARLGSKPEPTENDQSINGKSTKHKSTDNSDAHTDILSRLLSFSEIKKRQPHTQTPLNWSCLFQRQLDTLGWTNATLAREQKTAVQLWYDKLRDFSLLGATAEKISIDEALRLLKRCCDAPSTNPGSSHKGIRLLDTVEAAADYTHLWLLGVDQSRWPNTPTPNPLLPIRLQIQAGMPAVDNHAEVVLAQRLLQRLSDTNNQLVMSYAQLQEDVEQQLCTLLPELPAYQNPCTESLQHPYARSRNSSFHPLELIETGNAPPLLEQEYGVKGGASLIKTMIASPFNAFAQWRLGAEPLPTPKSGLDSGERGTLLHWTLDAVWAQIKSSTQLQQLSFEEQKKLCDNTAAKQVQSWQTRNGWLGKVAAQLEVDRLSLAAQDWLAFESHRAPFELIAAENELIANIGPLRFKMRMDRLDRLADGALVLIDYKTGSHLSKMGWSTDRLSEPQLPLYAISLPNAPDAICFAKVRPNEMCIIGIGREGYCKGINSQENWDEQLIEWREALTAVAQAFADGHTDTFESKSSFQQQDPLLSLHRFGERDQLLELQQQLPAQQSLLELNKQGEMDV